MDVFDAAERYRKDGRPLIVLAGKDYGSGSSRDWAAKGPWMLVGEGGRMVGGGGEGGRGGEVHVHVYVGFVSDGLITFQL